MSIETIVCTGYKKDYPLYLSYGEDFTDVLRLLPPTKKRFVIYDSILRDLFPDILNKLSESQETISMSIKATEQNKSFDVLRVLLQNTFDSTPSRDDLIVVVGGGLVLNIGGLTASLSMRGMRYVYIPTTLTSQIDAAFGSKQAVNFNGAKNWVGMYSDPEFVYINPHMLRFTPTREITSQWIEGVKLAIARDPSLFNEVYTELADFKDAPMNQVSKYLKRMITLKTDILSQDLMEEHVGMSMLYGHTVGHAIEILSKGKLNHGEAVGIGMWCAAQISHAMGYCNKELVTIHDTILQRLSLPARIPAEISPESIMKHLSYNKKNIGGSVPFCLLEDIGKMVNNDGDYLVVVPYAIIEKCVRNSY